jgi:predicted nucleic acid-binding protein
MNRGPFLVDTGFLVALANQSDKDHSTCTARWKAVQGPFLATEGVLFESAWLLRRLPDGFRKAVNLARSVGTRFLPITRWREDRAIELMQQYRDIPMDFVDALLVAIAEETGVRDVMTLDHRGFRVFRAVGRQFRIHP